MMYKNLTTYLFLTLATLLTGCGESNLGTTVSYCALDTQISNNNLCSKDTSEIVVNLNPNETLDKLIYRDGTFYQATQIVSHTTWHQMLEDPSLSTKEAIELINKSAASAEEKVIALHHLKTNQVQKRH